MYKTILIPVHLDHPEIAVDAIAHARRLAEPGATIHLLHVVEAIPAYAATYVPENLMRRGYDEAEQRLKAIAADAGEGVVAEVMQGHAPTAILDHAEEIGAQCIVIASHRPGIEDYFLGSTAARVVRHAQCSVLVLR